MMQVENEVGILGDARDHSDLANRAFESAVPAELTHRLVANRESLYPELRDLWEQNGAKTSATLGAGLFVGLGCEELPTIDLI